jgi:ABC-2 type transport system ATP-binding protein
MSAEPVIVASGLSKDFGSGRGLFGLDLEVTRGEVFGFLGPNGAGKSTTMRLLLDFIRPTSGSARILGLDTRTESVEIRRRVGFLPGDLALYPKLTGRALLDYLARLRGTSTAVSVSRWPTVSRPSWIGRSDSCRRGTGKNSV